MSLTLGIALMVALVCLAAVVAMVVEVLRPEPKPVRVRAERHSRRTRR